MDTNKTSGEKKVVYRNPFLALWVAIWVQLLVGWLVSRATTLIRPKYLNNCWINPALYTTPPDFLKALWQKTSMNIDIGNQHFWKISFTMCTVSHNVLVVDVLDVQRLHGVNQRLDGRDDVLKHQPSETPPVSLGVSTAMDDPHLFDESALPTFTRP